MFKHKALAMTAVALLFAAAPAYAAKADGPGEVALHIEAEAAIPPDRAEMTLSLTGKGTTREAALSDLRAKQTAIKSSLAGVGIGADKVKLLEPINDETIAVDEAAAAMASATAEAAAPNVGAKRHARPAPAPMVGVSADMKITLDDLTKLAGLQTAARANNVETYRLNYGGRFYSSDPAAARKRAREQAIAKARAEADAYAAAMGYHVVRLTRVSNTSPPLNMHDLHTAIGFANGARETMQPGFFASAAYATVGMDFIIAPN